MTVLRAVHRQPPARTSAVVHSSSPIACLVPALPTTRRSMFAALFAA